MLGESILYASEYLLEKLQKEGCRKAFPTEEDECEGQIS